MGPGPDDQPDDQPDGQPDDPRDGGRAPLGPLALPNGVAQVRPEAPAAVLMVEVAARRVVYANPVAVQMAPDLALPVATDDWSAAADLRDLDGELLADSDHPLSRVARFLPVAGQGVSAGRASDLGPRREPLWVVALPLEDAPNLAGHALVVFLPVRDREELQQRAADAHAGAARSTGRSRGSSAQRAALQEQRAVGEAAVLATGLSFTVADARAPDLPLVWVNPAFTAVTGYTRRAAVGRNCRFLQGPGTDARVTGAMGRALVARESITVTLLNYRADGTAFWNQVAMSPIMDPAGEVTHYVGIQTDVSGRVAADAERDRALAAERAAREHAEQARALAQEAQARAERSRADAQEAHARLALLAEVTRQLSGTSEAAEAMQRLAHLVVPVLGDFAVLALVDDGAAPAPDAPASRGERRASGAHGRSPGAPVRALCDVAWWHRDARWRPVLDEHARGRLGALSARGSQLLDEVMATGAPVLLGGPGAPLAEAVDALLVEGPSRTALRRLEATSVATFVLRGRGRTLGLLTVGTGPGRAPLAGDDLALGEDVAARAGQALEGARLYRQQRDLAVGLQRSLLTLGGMPETPHVRVAVRYVAAAEAAQVGGDFYDAFVQPGGGVVVVIGDVMGHDTEAAAAMAQLRSTVRALGVVGDDGPAVVLRRADEVMAAVGADTTATALAARLSAGAGAGGARVLQWSSAGHPPAVVVGPDGAVTALEADEEDLLLGVDAATPRAQHAAALAPGSMVLLHTDGLVERRDQSLTDGLARLRAVLRELAGRGLDAEQLVDAVLAAMVPARPEDDVAVVALALRA